MVNYENGESKSGVPQDDEVVKNVVERLQEPNGKNPERVFSLQEMRRVLKNRYLQSAAAGALYATVLSSAFHHKQLKDQRPDISLRFEYDGREKSPTRKLFEVTYSTEQMAEYDHVKKALEVYLGEGPLLALEHADEEAILIRKKQKPTPPVIIGFEKAGADAHLLKKAWTEGIYYPKGWIDGEVDAIEYVDVVEPMPASYGDNFKDSSAAAEAGLKKITFFASKKDATEAHNTASQNTAVLAPTETQKDQGIDFNFGHEIGHINSWDQDGNMTLLQRAQLLEQMVYRVRGVLPRPDEYVDHISSPNKQLELYIKCAEYWAQICCVYFNEPMLLRMEHPDDYQIVDNTVRLTDPEFNPQKAADDRYNLLHPGAHRGYFSSQGQYIYDWKSGYDSGKNIVDFDAADATEIYTTNLGLHKKHDSKPHHKKK